MLKSKTPPTPPLTADLRAALKIIVQKELEALPATLEALDPVQRIGVVCKLIAYVLPKVETVNHKEGEPFSFKL